MITTNDKDLHDKISQLRTHGITKDPELMRENHGGWYYDMTELGYNYRITDFQSALGMSQLNRAEEGLEKRKAIARRYDEAFINIAVHPVRPAENVDHAYHLYVVLVKNRKELYDHLKSQNIYAQIHYVPTHMLSYYQELGHRHGDLPKAEAYYEQCLSLPMYPTLSAEQQDYVIETILNFVNSK